MKKRKFTISVLVLACAFELTGCSTRQVKLYYPAEPRAVASQSASSTDNADQSNTREIILDTFDARAEKNRLSNRSNGGYVGFQFTVFATDDDIANWVSDAVAYELREAGYSVIRKDDRTSNDALPELTVDLQKLFARVTAEITTEALIQATLQRENKTQITRQYCGAGRATNWVDSGETFAKSLALALQDAISQMLEDFGLSHSL
jgi:uncharacterized lipoprotein YajG